MRPLQLHSPVKVKGPSCVFLEMVYWLSSIRRPRVPRFTSSIEHEEILSPSFCGRSRRKNAVGGFSQMPRIAGTGEKAAAFAAPQRLSLPAKNTLYCKTPKELILLSYKQTEWSCLSSLDRITSLAKPPSRSLF